MPVEDGAEAELSPTTAQSSPPQELVIGFWTLVILAKLVVLVFSAGVIVLAFTDVPIAGAALILLGVGVAIRWVRLFRRVRKD